MVVHAVVSSLALIVLGMIPLFGLSLYFSRLTQGKASQATKQMTAVLSWTLVTVSVIATFDALVLSYVAQGLWYWFRLATMVIGGAAIVRLGIKEGFKSTFLNLLRPISFFALVLIGITLIHQPILKSWLIVENETIITNHLIPDVTRHIIYIQEKGRADYLGPMIAPNAYPEKVGAYYYAMHSTMSLLTWFRSTFQPGDYLAAYLAFLALALTAAAALVWMRFSLLIALIFLLFIFVWNSVTDPWHYSLFLWFLFNPSNFAHLATVVALTAIFLQPRLGLTVLAMVGLLASFAQAAKPPSLFLNLSPLAVLTVRYSAWIKVRGWRWFFPPNPMRLRQLLPLFFTLLPFIITLGVQKAVSYRDVLGRALVVKPRNFIAENVTAWDDWNQWSWFKRPWQGLEAIFSGWFPGETRLYSFVATGVSLAVGVMIFVALAGWLVRKYLSRQEEVRRDDFWPGFSCLMIFLLLGYLSPAFLAVRYQPLSWEGLINSMSQSLHLFGLALAIGGIAVSTQVAVGKAAWRSAGQPFLFMVIVIVGSVLVWQIGSNEPFKMRNLLIGGEAAPVTNRQVISKQELAAYLKYQNGICPPDTSDEMQSFVGCRSSLGPYWFYR